MIDGFASESKKEGVVAAEFVEEVGFAFGGAGEVVERNGELAAPGLPMLGDLEMKSGLLVGGEAGVGEFPVGFDEGGDIVVPALRSEVEIVMRIPAFWSGWGFGGPGNGELSCEFEAFFAKGAEADGTSENFSRRMIGGEGIEACFKLIERRELDDGVNPLGNFQFGMEVERIECRVLVLLEKAFVFELQEDGEGEAGLIGAEVGHGEVKAGGRDEGAVGEFGEEFFEAARSFEVLFEARESDGFGVKEFVGDFNLESKFEEAEGLGVFSGARGGPAEN